MGSTEFSLMIARSEHGAVKGPEGQPEQISDRDRQAPLLVRQNTESQPLAHESGRTFVRTASIVKDEAAVELNNWVAEHFDELAPDDIATLLVFGRATAKNSH